MRLSAIKVVALLGAVSILNQEASAIITSGAVTGGTASGAGGVFTELTVPILNPLGPANSVGNDTFQTPNLYAFNESQNAVVAAAGLTVNVTPTAAPLGYGVTSPGFITAGTVVASHYVFFDPGPSQTQLGYVDFDSPILGLVTLTASLLASDYLANTGVNYLNPGLRGLEANTDTAYVLTSQPNRVYVDWSASTPGDYIRVLTAFSPGAVPDVGSTMLLLGLGMTGLSVVRRRLSHWSTSEPSE